MNSKINNYLVLAGIAGGILILWFLLGFVLPVVMFEEGYKDGGTFGDSFGSVNALFTGLGFVGISYTIYLQIENSREQKHQDEFMLYIKLFDDLREDLNNIQFQDSNYPTNNLSGVNAINRLMQLIQHGYFIGTSVKYKPHFIYLTNINIQLIVLTDLIHNNKLITQDKQDILTAKIAQTYLGYLVEFYNLVPDLNSEEPFFKEFKHTVKELAERMEDYLSAGLKQ
jgi:hypothetical protein